MMEIKSWALRTVFSLKEERRASCSGVMFVMVWLLLLMKKVQLKRWEKI